MSRIIICFVFNMSHANPVYVCVSESLCCSSDLRNMWKNVEELYLPVQFKFSPLIGYDMTDIEVNEI